MRRSFVLRPRGGSPAAARCADVCRPGPCCPGIGALRIDAFMESLLERLKLRQDLALGASDILGKIDLDPGRAGHVRELERLALLEDQVPNRLLVGQMGLLALYIARHEGREAARAGRIE